MQRCLGARATHSPPVPGRTHNVSHMAHIHDCTCPTLTMQVELEVPGWCGFISNQTIEGTGSGVLQNVLNLMVRAPAPSAHLGWLRKWLRTWLCTISPPCELGQ